MMMMMVVVVVLLQRSLLRRTARSRARVWVGIKRRLMRVRDGDIPPSQQLPVSRFKCSSGILDKHHVQMRQRLEPVRQYDGHSRRGGTEGR